MNSAVQKIDWDLEISAYEATQFVEVPLSESTDLDLLSWCVQFYGDYLKSHNSSHYQYAHYLRLFNEAVARIKHLDALIVKTPPITPQLTLF